jgi:hypothetical protein
MDLRRASRVGQACQTAPVRASAAGAGQVDLWLALAIGPGAWMAPGRGTPAQRALLLAESITGVALASVVGAAATASGHVVGTTPAVAFVSGVALALVLLVGPAWPGPVTSRLAASWSGGIAVALLRLAGLLLLLFTAAVALGGVSLLLVGAVGLLLGVDVAVSLDALGMTGDPAASPRRLLTSPLHLGALLTLGALAVGAWLELLAVSPVRTAATVYVLAGTAWVASRPAARVLAAEAAHDAAVARDTGAAALRQDAAWLHDDVCSEIGYLSMRLQVEEIDQDEVRAAVLRLDHRIRLRQLEQHIRGGPVRLGEIIQPFLRVAQHQGLVRIDAPDFDVTAVVLDADRARLAQRSLGVLVPNALQAGATWLAVRASVDGAALHLQVEDDAGGFTGKPQVGRGLDGLRRDLGDDRLTLVRTNVGTRATATIALGGGTA